MSDNRLKIGITQGDTNGIGWEVILKTLADSRGSTELCTPVVYGSPAAAAYYRRCRRRAWSRSPSTPSPRRADARRGQRRTSIACGPQDVADIVAGATRRPKPDARPSRRCADRHARPEGGYTSTRSSPRPIDKETAQADDFRYTGHTEYLAAELEGDAHDADVQRSCCAWGSSPTHLPPAGGARRDHHAERADRARPRHGSRRCAASPTSASSKPRIAVHGAQPPRRRRRAVGQARRRRSICPAVERGAYAAGVLAFGPFAADGLFRQRQTTRTYDAVLAMYHDQGLAPFKTPHARRRELHGRPVQTCAPRPTTAWPTTSPGRDKADPQSMRNAIYAALDIVENRRRWAAMSADPLQHFERDRGRDASAKDLPEMREGRHD